MLADPSRDNQTLKEVTSSPAAEKKPSIRPAHRIKAHIRLKSLRIEQLPVKLADFSSLGLLSEQFDPRKPETSKFLVPLRDQLQEEQIGKLEFSGKPVVFNIPRGWSENAPKLLARSILIRKSSGGVLEVVSVLTTGGEVYDAPSQLPGLPYKLAKHYTKGASVIKKGVDEYWWSTRRRG